MSSAPDRISIKRRRDDEVVDVLALTSTKKQRTSGHYFVRLGHQNIAILSQQPSSVSKTSQATTIPSLPPPGVPVVGSTLPGDEIRDFQKYKAAQDLRNGVVLEKAKSNLTAPSQQVDSVTQPPPDARRFHLTRDLSLALRPHQAGGIRKAKSFVRPHIPTFIERLQRAIAEDPVGYAEPPIDRIIRSVDGANHELDAQRILSEDGTVKKEKTATFQRSKSSIAKTGQSIQDDPATWDLDSDRLADELMTLALEMDPDAKALYDAESEPHQDTAAQKTYIDAMLVDGLDDYVYETYVRVQPKGVPGFENLTQSNNLGYLVIDEEEEDLWEQYLNDDDDDDDDWDEEDADSNAEDNPRNDYPEDEVSSDDEYGRNVYQYRRDYSDDEQFDTEYQ